jgi:hypothetical protein
MNDIDGVAGTSAGEDAVVVDFAVPIDCLGNAEFAAAAATALRDVVGHTLIFFGKQDGKNATGHGSIGGVAGAPVEQTVVTIDFP